MKFVQPKNLTPLAKAVAVAIVGAALSANVQQLRDKVLPLVNHHPVLSAVLGGVFSLLLLVQQPAVQSALRDCIAEEDATPDTPPASK